jgi:uncharacterized membrane protein YphA (DoxX/SURF4 family)
MKLGEKMDNKGNGFIYGHIKSGVSWLAVFSRVMAGLLFGMVGWYKVFVMGADAHAQKLFVEGYADYWIPAGLLYATGFVIPFIELVAGWALVVGWRRRESAVILGFLLLTVLYGHALKEPFFDVTTHILPRFLLLIPVLLWDEAVDRFSLDGLLAGRKKA